MTDLDPQDLQIHTWSAGFGEKHVVVVHRPTNIRGEGTDRSGIRAREMAIKDVRAQLENQ